MPGRVPPCLGPRFAPRGGGRYGPPAIRRADAAARCGTRPAATKRTPVPDIFDEVDEDLRADRAARLLKKYGGAVSYTHLTLPTILRV